MSLLATVASQAEEIEMASRRKYTVTVLVDGSPVEAHVYALPGREASVAAMARKVLRNRGLVLGRTVAVEMES